MKTLRTIVVLSILLVSAFGRAVAADLNEYGVKGAFILNFTQFVSWPDDRLASDAPLAICVFNDSPVAQHLKARSNQPAKGHPIRVRTATAVTDLGSCHVVFLPASESGRAKEISARYRGAGLLLISEDQSGDDIESAINLVMVDRRIGFEVNLDVARAMRVDLSSKLIRLARRVVGVASIMTPDPSDADRGRRD